jgi:uncharacterized protein (DUF1800 family)
MGTSWAGMARLLRRTGFGATGQDVDAALPRGIPATVAAMVAADPAADPGARATPLPHLSYVPRVGKSASVQERGDHIAAQRAQLTTLTAWWLRRIAAVEQPFGEKLTFCWHNHFATSASKVRQATWLAAQNERLRALGRGNFRTLAFAMLTDAAMLVWLDGQKNVAGAANENLAREFMELFTLGHGDGYTETDVREGARALTGWRVRPDGSTHFLPRLHDAGRKTVLGVTGDLDAAGFCDAVLAQPASPRYLATRWWQQLASDSPPPTNVIDRLAEAYGSQRSMIGLLTALLTSDEFFAATGTAVLSPVEWLLGAVRTLQVPLTSDAVVKQLGGALRGLGQLPFYPPSVAGWPTGQAWLSTAAGELRLRVALLLVAKGNLDVVRDAPQASRLDVTAHFLGLDGWSNSTLTVLGDQVSSPRRLVAVALNSPEYLTA